MFRRFPQCRSQQCNAGFRGNSTGDSNSWIRSAPPAAWEWTHRFSMVPAVAESFHCPTSRRLSRPRGGWVTFLLGHLPIKKNVTRPGPIKTRTVPSHVLSQFRCRRKRKVGQNLPSRPAVESRPTVRVPSHSSSPVPTVRVPSPQFESRPHSSSPVPTVPYLGTPFVRARPPPQRRSRAQAHRDPLALVKMALSRSYRHECGSARSSFYALVNNIESFSRRGRVFHLSYS